MQKRTRWRRVGWAGRLALALVVVASMVPPGAAAAPPVALGMWDGWAAFRDDDPVSRCWAVALPVAISRGQRARPSIAIVRTPPSTRAELRVGLSRPAAGGRVRLSIGSRTIGLVADGASAHALHAGADASIVAAMRGAETLVVTGRDATGRPFRDVYALAGAATAIDAAMLGCRPG